MWLSSSNILVWSRVSFSHQLNNLVYIPPVEEERKSATDVGGAFESAFSESNARCSTRPLTFSLHVCVCMYVCVCVCVHVCVCTCRVSYCCFLHKAPATVGETSKGAGKVAGDGNDW